jgi:hypothetical protein
MLVLAAAKRWNVVPASCRAHPNLGGYIGVTLLGTQRPSKTELVTIRVGQVKESLAPFGISRGGVRPIPRRDYTPIERINVRIVEDHSSPPGPMPLGWLGS